MTMPMTDIPKKIVNLDCGGYIVRTAAVGDASDRWAAWMADPEANHMLNAPAQFLKKADIESYIAQFDQRSHLLLGIFEKPSDKQLGFLRVDIDDKLGRFLVNMLIGEPEYRNKGVTNEITVPFRDYFYETLGLKTMLATALSRNQPIIHYLLKTGWSLDKTVERHVKSRTDETMLDLCFFSLTREAWRAWKKANLQPDKVKPPTRTIGSATRSDSRGKT
jgi:RimJ/RimL family protein N-acetyltransferase